VTRPPWYLECAHQHATKRPRTGRAVNLAAYRDVVAIYIMLALPARRRRRKSSPAALPQRKRLASEVPGGQQEESQRISALNHSS